MTSERAKREGEVNFKLKHPISRYMNPKLLEDLGLTKLEAQIYLALLDLGPSLASTISQSSGVHRRSVYDAVERLIEKGLVGYITKNNRRYYEATDPAKLLGLLKEKEKIIESVLPELQEKYKKSKDKQETSIYLGITGLKIVYEDMLEQNEDILYLGAMDYEKVIGKYFFPQFHLRRDKKDIPMKIVFDEKYKKYKLKLPKAEIRYLEGYGSPLSIAIYGNRTALTTWTEHPLAILIKDESIAKSYQKHFQIIWNLAKP